MIALWSLLSGLANLFRVLLNTAHMKNRDPLQLIFANSRICRSQQICGVIYSLEDFTLMWESRALLYIIKSACE